jgi:hypothetical protein
LPPLASPFFSSHRASACLFLTISASLRTIEPVRLIFGDGAAVIEWPEWWSWEIQMLLHVQERMVDRSFTETDLRLMLEDAEDLIPSHVPGRWLVVARLHGVAWNIVVEPDAEERILIVVTAYEVR